MFRYLRQRVVANAIGRGVLGGSRGWLIVAVVLGARFVVRRLSGDAETTLYSEELGPNDRLLIGPVQD